MRTVLLLASLTVLSGCASLSKEECLAIDWREVGHTDGAKGAGHGRIAEHREACAKHGVRVNLDQYNVGRDQGLRSFCQSNSGFSRGRQGYRYAGICPGDLESDFLEAYDEGKAIYRVEQKISQLQSGVSNSKYRVKKLKKKVAAKEDAMLVDGIKSEHRRKLYREVKTLKEELHKKDYDREDFERKIYHLRIERDKLLDNSRYH